MGIRTITAVVVLFLLPSCFRAFDEPTSRKDMESHVYDSGYDVVFPAVREVFKTLGYEILKADGDLGLIETELVEAGSVRSRALAEVNSLNSYQTEVRVGIRLEDNKGRAEPIKISRYERLFEEIEFQVYREHMNKMERRAREGR